MPYENSALWTTSVHRKIGTVHLSRVSVCPILQFPHPRKPGVQCCLEYGHGMERHQKIIAVSRHVDAKYMCPREMKRSMVKRSVWSALRSHAALSKPYPTRKSSVGEETCNIATKKNTCENPLQILHRYREVPALNSNSFLPGSCRRWFGPFSRCLSCKAASVN